MELVDYHEHSLYFLKGTKQQCFIFGGIQNVLFSLPLLYIVDGLVPLLLFFSSLIVVSVLGLFFVHKSKNITLGLFAGQTVLTSIISMVLVLILVEFFQ